MVDQHFTIDVEYSITYATKKPVPIDKIVESLRNLERILHRTGPFIEAAYDGVKVYDIEVYVKDLHSGSLKNNLIVKYVLGGQDNADNLRELCHKIMDDAPVIKYTVAMGVGAILAYGAMKALPIGTPAEHLEAHNSVIIKAGESVHISSEKLSEILDGISDKKTLAKEAIGAMSPSIAEGAPIVFPEADDLSFPSEVVQEVPESYEPPVPDEVEERYNNVKVLISASDRDHLEKGWAGIIPQVAESRTKIILDEAIDPRRLHGRTQVQADVTVTSRFIKSRKAYEVKLIEIHAIK